MRTNKIIRHKWTHNNLFSVCKNCYIRKHTTQENEMQPDGSTKRVFKIVYFLADGEIIKNKGCIKEKQLILNL